MQLSPKTHQKIMDLCQLCLEVFKQPLDGVAVVAAVALHADQLLSVRVFESQVHQDVNLFSWLEHQALQTEINHWLTENDINGLGNQFSTMAQQKQFIRGLIQLGLAESALSCIGRGQQRKDDNQLMLLRGLAMSAMGMPEVAAECFQTVALIATEDHQAYFYLANEYMKLGKHALALKAFDDAIACRPDLPGAWHNKGITYYQLENFEQAIPLFEKATILAPDNIGSWINLSKCYLAIKQPQTALLTLKNAIILHENHPELDKTIGIIYKQLGDDDSAIYHLNSAINKTPNEIELYQVRAEVLMKLKNYDLALADIELLNTIEPYDSECCCLKFEALFALQRYREAESCFYFLVGINPLAYSRYEQELNTIRQHLQIPSCQKL
ncbi:hypothetical protein UB37_14510 [Photobacterium iliopiscarium]|uniref:Tetratricopeptide repeat protein n=1 Tax=Photobacterium iliopiscarium TaxID=56192 RepID=A0ABX5GT20_9GAMM|nr:tetratricopeptide repeat protein [Photobacterium iliopiscarium]KJG20406.1 hypothetical protein UB37_14510 [Photobacterium iliopiscarium]PSW98139.1 tetratricopeptide repeat protein [Photobacterium iliopiscarium]